MNSWVDLHALWQIVVIGLLAGAGLPALFAVGLRALGQPGRTPSGPAAGGDRSYGGSPVGLTGAVICFAVVIAAVAWGIYFIVKAS